MSEAAMEHDRQGSGPGVPEMVYSSRLETTRQQLSQCQQVDRRFVLIRIALFLTVVVLAAICAGDTGMSWWWLTLPTGLLLAIVVIHGQALTRQARLLTLTGFFEGCLDRINHRWNERAQNGARFACDQHSWSQDLDLFGAGSLFQLLCECRTAPGQKQLAEWMTTVPTEAGIRTRQARSAAMRQQLDLREALATAIDAKDSGEWEHTLLNWAAEPAPPIPGAVVWASSLLGLAAIPVIALISVEVLPLSAALLVAILQTPLIVLTRQRIRATAAAMDRVDRSLHQLADVIRVFEGEPFRHPLLCELQQGFASGGGTASASIASLSRLTRWLNQSLRNQFFGPIAWMGGLLVLLTSRMEHWRRLHGPSVGMWIRTCAEFEATVSIAAWNFEHPEFAVPELCVPRRFEAIGLGHPLISPRQRVVNDVLLSGERPLMLISGSNMSGKSTLLRSVGCNLVLMHCGAVVVARQLISCPFMIGTAMRVSDSLQEGRSLFMNVVDRLRMVVELTQRSEAVIFLLDEILQGTNSHDRRLGAEAVIRMLINSGAIGMVTTHDLALTHIVDTLEGRAVNMHFEDTIVDGQMSFDYQLKPGVVARSNALHLMRLMGLDVSEE